MAVKKGNVNIVKLLLSNENIDINYLNILVIFLNTVTKKIYK